MYDYNFFLATGPGRPIQQFLVICLFLCSTVNLTTSCGSKSELDEIMLDFWILCCRPLLLQFFCLRWCIEAGKISIKEFNVIGNWKSESLLLKARNKFVFIKVIMIHYAVVIGEYTRDRILTLMDKPGLYYSIL